MGHDLFFGSQRNTVAGREAKKRALIGCQAGTGVAFNNAGQLLLHAHRPQDVRTTLGMPDSVGPAPADIMEHGSLFHKEKMHIRVFLCIGAGTIPDSPAVGYDLCTAPGIVQESLAGKGNCIRHGPASS